MEKVVRTSLKNDFPMVRKQAVSVFSLLVLRCQCALSGIAFKDEAYESQPNPRAFPSAPDAAVPRVRS